MSHFRTLLVVVLLKDKITWSLSDNHRISTCSSEPRCKCTQFGGGKYKADCSSLGLHEFPEFSEDVIEITFFKNSFHSLTASSVLPKGLIHLDLSSCKLKEIYKGFLQNFSRLEYLDISHNRELTLTVLPNVTYDLQFTNIKTLKFNAVQCKYGKGLIFYPAYTQYLKNTSLEEVQLSSNRIKIIEQFVLSNLPDSMQSITAADNRLIFSYAVLEIPYMKNLRFADFSRQYSSSSSYLSIFERKHCNDSQTYEVEEKLKLTLSLPLQSPTKPAKLESCLNEHITVPPNRQINFYLCFPNVLETILVESSSIGNANIPNIHHIMFDFRHVKHVNVKGNMFTGLNSGVIFSNYSSVLDYSENYISEINSTWFQDANLSDLDLSGNYLNSYFKKENSGNLLDNQFFLRNLSLARNGIACLPNGIFKDTINLREIDLSFNELENVQFIGPNLKAISLLNIRGNHIHTLSSQEMKVLDSVVSDCLTIDLSENDIMCSCDTLNFLTWMQSHAMGSRIIFRNLKSYKCTFQNSTKFNLSELHNIIGMLEKQCSTYTGLIVVSAMVLSVAIIILICGVLYRHRWKLRYIYYMVKRGYKGNAHTRLMNQRELFQFDAFISYADEDKNIFLKNLISVTEEKSDLKLCLHERDFTPGCDIAENIANAIRDSRKTVCMISNNYLSSRWCMYEFNMALMERIHARDDDSMLIIVLLGDLNITRAPMSMMEFIQSSTYIEFPKDPTYQSLFWSKLSDSLN